MKLLEEFTVELETRPMVSLDPGILVRLQTAAMGSELLDPVFALDESKGSILVVCQVWAATAALAAALGCWAFTTMLVKTGIDRSKAAVEFIATSKAENEKLGKIRMQPLKEKLST